jgi:HD superfamily phosphodiesterase
MSKLYAEPDRFTIVPANLKILKVLVEELHSAAGGKADHEAAAIEALAEEESGDEEEWEDDEAFLDLGLGATKKGMYL